MSRLRAGWRRLRNVFAQDRLDRELSEELSTLFDLHVQENLRRGLDEKDARRAAHLAMGNTVALRETHRDTRGLPWIEMFVNDLRYATRTLRRSPGFTLVIVLSLAIGIGANSALFSVAHAVMLRTLAVPDAEDVYVGRIRSTVTLPQRFSYPLYQQLAAVAPQPAGLAAASRVARMRFALAGDVEPTRGAMQLVTPSFFSTLRLQPSLGRFFNDEENRIGGPHLVGVISHGFWRRRFASRPEAVGQTIVINNVSVTIVGVGPQRFTGIWLESPVDVWLPVVAQPDVRYIQNFSATNADLSQPWPPQAGMSWLEILLRADRADGPQTAALNSAYRSSIEAEAKEIANAHDRELLLTRNFAIEPFARGYSSLRDRFQTPLIALLTMVGLLLLLACANTANLLLARAAARQREIAVRLSIGASRARLVAQLLTESLLLGILAGSIGLLLAPFASELLVRWTLSADTVSVPFDVGVDLRVLLFTLALSVVTSVLFGFVPARRTTAPGLLMALRDGGRVHRGANHGAASALVVAQVTLSVVLLVAAGLFVRSFANLRSLDLGFEPTHLLSASINTQSFSVERLPAYYERLLARAAALPGVRAVSLATCGIMNGCRSTADGLLIEGYTPARSEQVIVQENRVTSGYFETTGLQLIAGRGFDTRDVTAPERVAIVNEAMVAKYFNGANPIGKKFGDPQLDTEIIGVVRDARLNAVRESPVPMTFHPLRGQTRANVLDVRTATDPHALATTLRTAILEVDRSVPVDRVTVVADNAMDTIRHDRLMAMLASVFGVIAVTLACLGLYGLMSYGVRQRRSEIGVRLALGAPRARVLWTVLRECLTLTALGIGAGLVVVFAGSRVVRTLLFEVTPLDPVTITAGVAAVAIVAAASGFLPARRASLVDPVVALRDE